MGLFVEKLTSAPLALTFDDVLLVPQYSEVRLGQIDVSTRLTPRVRLKIPIVSSPMDTVTGREMALEMGRLGGLGVLPRNISVEKSVAIIREVK